MREDPLVVVVVTLFASYNGLVFSEFQNPRRGKSGTINQSFRAFFVGPIMIHQSVSHELF